MSEQSLKEKTVKGVGWSALDNVSQNVISFIISVVLARLLSPDDYGLIGIIAVFTAISTVLINSGFKSALLRRESVSEVEYSTAFIINVGVSVFLYILLFACSSLIAKFFAREELVSLIRVSSLSIVIGAFALVQQTRLTKRLDFKSQTKITIIASVVSGFLGIMLAFGGYGVWALVTQQLIRQIITTFMLTIYNKWMPKLLFSNSSFHELFGYGWKMLVSGILDTTWREVNQVVIGRFYNAASLGQFTRAMQFSNLLSDSLTSVIQRVSFPVLSIIQSDKIKMTYVYRRIIKITMYISFFSMFLLGAVSEPFLYCLIGPQWHEASNYLPLLCISGSIFPLHVINLNMLQVQGRSDLFLGLELVKKAIAVAPILLGIFWGIKPMLCANIVVSIVSFFLNSYYSGRLIGYSSYMQIKDIAPYFGIATMITVPIWFLKYLPLSYWIILPLQGLIGMFFFIILSKILHIDEYSELKEIITPYLKKIKL